MADHDKITVKRRYKRLLELYWHPLLLDRYKWRWGRCSVFRRVLVLIMDSRFQCHGGQGL